MRIYWVTIELINGDKFEGPVTARSARAAEDRVYTDVPYRTVVHMQVEAV